jgi:cation transport ATPase
MANEEQFKAETKEKIKRFNDIYSIVFIVITILLSVGANTFAKENLAGTLIFTFGSLVIWALGHSIGAKASLQEKEIQIKIIAWFCASLVACAVILKYILGTTKLNPVISLWLMLASFLLTTAFFVYLRNGLSERAQGGLAMFMLPTFAILLAFLHFQE